MRMPCLFCVLSILFTVPSFAASKPQAKTDSLKTYWLSEIVITAQRQENKPLTPLLEINTRAIRRTDITEVSQALNLVPSLNLSVSAKNEKTFRLRGIDQRQISVFLDGIPISIPYNGMVDLSQFSEDNIAKIRVASGISSVLFGTNNIGGSVNIITEEPSVSGKAKIRLETAPYGHFYASASLGKSFHRLMYLVSFAYNNASDFVLSQNSPPMPNENGNRRDHSSFRKMNGFAKIRYAINDHHLVGLHLGWVNNRFDVPPNAVSQRPRYWKFPEWNRYLIGLNTYHTFKYLFLRSTVYLDKYQNTLKSYDDASYSSQSKRYAFTSTYDDYSLGINLFPEIRFFPFGKTSGLLAFKKDVHREQSNGGAFEEYSMQTVSAGLEQNMRYSRYGSFQIAGDIDYLKPLKAQNYNVRDALFLANGQISFNYSPHKFWTLHLASARKSRFPTLKELYSQYLGRSVANPNLKPEYGLNNEIGLHFGHHPFNADWTVFYNRLSRLIVPVVIGKRLTQMQNIGRADFYGTELFFRHHGQRIEWLGHYTYLQARNRSKQRTSSHLQYRPEHSFFLMFNYNVTPAWNLEAEWQGMAGQYYQNPDNLRWQKLNDYFLLNARIQFNRNRMLKFYVRVNNIFDRFYFSEWGVPMPGRQIILGLKSEL